jgi:hypothetical protein
MRRGGRNQENVLTTEVLQALDWLPRSAFLGAVMARLHGTIDSPNGALQRSAEHLSFSVLPGWYYLNSTLGTKIEVQPDALLQSESVLVMVEAKRFGPAYFTTHQLAREFLLAHQIAGDRTPLLLLIIDKGPNVLVKLRGRCPIEHAIVESLPALVPPQEIATWRSRIPATVAWITWNEIAEVLQGSLRAYKTSDPSHRASVERLAGHAAGIIQWHAGA